MNARELRDRAVRYRLLAQRADHEMTAQALIGIAADLEARAASLEGAHASPVPSPPTTTQVHAQQAKLGDGDSF